MIVERKRKFREATSTGSRVAGARPARINTILSLPTLPEAHSATGPSLESQRRREQIFGGIGNAGAHVEQQSTSRLTNFVLASPKVAGVLRILRTPATVVPTVEPTPQSMALGPTCGPVARIPTQIAMATMARGALRSVSDGQTLLRTSSPTWERSHPGNTVWIASTTIKGTHQTIAAGRPARSKLETRERAG